jgi:hypothetical protein
MACDLILGAGVKRTALPARLQQSIHAFEALPGSMEHVLLWRETLRRDPPDETSPITRLIKTHRSVGVVLPHDADDRVISQWHRLAGDVQHRVRLAVMVLPHPEALNARGVQAVIAWRTGCSVATGSVDFAQDGDDPQPGQSWQPNTAAAYDLLVDTSLQGLDKPPDDVSLIRISSEASPDALYSFVAPDLSPGLAAQVMRFDGQLLHLTPEDQPAQPDLTALLLSELAHRLSDKTASYSQGAI